MNKSLRFSALLLPLLLCACTTTTEKRDLPRYASYEEAGFSADGIEAAKEIMDSAGTAVASVVIVYKGKVLVDWGDTEFPYKSHSVRKGLLSSLYGIHIAEGDIDPESTLGDLGIDDNEPLTDLEKQATVMQLLQSRSGVYLPAASETEGIAAARPERGCHAPGEHYYYNNWSFNALGTIFEEQTGKKIFEDFAERIAGPIGMQDFDPTACFYIYEKEHSKHPAYFFRISTRDRARFGLLYLRNGAWNDEQLIDEGWVKGCMKGISPISDRISGVLVGIMWGMLEKNAQIYDAVPVYEAITELRNYDFYMLAGFGGQLIGLVPEMDLVIAVSGDTEDGESAAGVECLQLLDTVLGAKIE